MDQNTTSLHSSDFSKKLVHHIPALLSLWRKNGSSSRLTPQELKSVSSALLVLQRGLTGDRKLAGAGYMDNDALLGSYLLYYWPVSYLQISYGASFAASRFTQAAKNASSNGRPLRILDLGSGPAPASAALLDIVTPFCENAEVTLADSSSKSLSLAEKLLRKEFSAVTCTTLTADFEHNGIEKIIASQKKESFDIIVMCHALNELWQNDSDCLEKRFDFLKKSSSLLSSDGFLYLCEPALLTTSRNLLVLRDKLLADGWNVESPCPINNQTHTNKHDNIQCPAIAAGPQHTCHAELPWFPPEPVASIAKSAALDRESVKMTFFVFSKNKNESHEQSDSEKSSAAPEAAETVRFSGRVVSEGMLNKSGRIRFLICDGKNRIPLSAKNGDAHAKAEGFFALQRYDLVALEKPEIRGDDQHKSLGISPETKLIITK